MDFGSVLGFAAGLAVLLGGMAGWCVLLCKKAGLKPDFAPAVVSGIFVCLLFAGGLAGCLLPAAYVVVGVGCLLLLWWGLACLRRKSFVSELKSLVTPGVLFFLAAAVVGCVVMRGPMPFVGDSYNHWATIVKLMHIVDRLPDATDQIIVFQSYPPGSALFLYLVTTLTGFSESHMVWGHFLLMLAGMTCLFGVVPKKHGWVAGLAACLCVFLFLARRTFLKCWWTASWAFWGWPGRPLFCITAGSRCGRRCLFCPFRQPVCLQKTAGCFSLP